METRVILDADVLKSKDANVIYVKLLTSPPLLFSKIAKELSSAGLVTEWHKSTDSSARVLACACDVANGNPDALAKFMEEVRLADKSSFENFDRIVYLADALMLTRQNSNVVYYDMAPIQVKMDEASKELREMVGKYAEHFWRDMPEPFFLHVTSHLTQPYRIQRLSHWANHRWPHYTDEEREEKGILFSSSYFQSDCNNLILKTLLSTDLTWFDEDGLAAILLNQCDAYPALKQLTEDERALVWMSLMWTMSQHASKTRGEPDKAFLYKLDHHEPYYKNFSGLSFHDRDLSGLDLKGANLLNANLNMANCKGTKLCQANMTNVNFMYAGAVFDDL